MSSSLRDVVTGPGLCAALTALDPAAVTDDALLDVVVAASRQLAFQQAQMWAVLAELGNRPPAIFAGEWNPAEVFESAVDELRAELRITRRHARRELEHADAVDAQPRVARALGRGDLDRGRAIVLADACSDLTAEQAGRLLDALLPLASHVTPPDLADRARRLAVALDPAWAERRYREAVRERKVVGYLNGDGSATVSGQCLPAEQAAAACARLDAVAARAKAAGAHASTDQLRAELFLGLLDGRFSGLGENALVAELRRLFPPNVSDDDVESDDKVESDDNVESADNAASFAVDSCDGVRSGPGGERGVELQVGLGALLGRNDEPGELAGWGPVTAAIARRVVARQVGCQWRFAILDDDGRLIRDGLLRARPGAGAAPSMPGGTVEVLVPAAWLADEGLAHRHPQWARVLGELTRQLAAPQRVCGQQPAARFAGAVLRRRTEVRFRTCLFPGCRRPATGCQIDHTRDHAAGGRTDEANSSPLCAHDHDNKTRRGWRLVRTAADTYTWVSPLGRRHRVQVGPIAAPLPAPIPRPDIAAPAYRCADLDDLAGAAGPTFEYLDRHGRAVRVPAEVGPAPIGRPAPADPDPPPPF